MNDHDLPSADSPQERQVSPYLLAFIPRKNYFVTPLIINLNIAVYLFLLFMGADPLSPSSDIILKWGANFAPLTLDGEWWRLLTSCFLHFGILHLAFNMYALFFIGFLLEPLLGKSRFLVAYLSCGLLSSLASLWWNTLVVSAGASGAVFGMYGLFLALLTTNLIPKQYRQSQLKTMMIFVVFNLAIGTAGGIDNAAHIGGLVTGIIIGYLYYPSIIRPRSTTLKYTTALLLAICVGMGATFAYQQVPRDGAVYYNIISRFEDLDANASDFSKDISDLPPDKMLEKLEKLNNHYWTPAITQLQRAQSLHLSKEDQQKAKKLMRYCELRIQFNQLYARSIKEDTNQYNAQLTHINSQIEALLTDLNSNN